MNRLEHGILSLEELPNRYAMYQSSRLSDIRMLLIDNYCVFYTADNEAVTVIRVLYNKRNINDFM
ncbi:MAG: type II toxin-antitoxin system RelE/ParE family toxin [Lachnospirales bacterium]